jgi:2-polyprenyl-3-methyl-5-hydroxy-6-metoxy-1,4-benzoquinol methylase
MNISNLSHWDKIYETKEFQEVGWYQKVPQTSLDLIHNLNLPKTASIIDIGGGDSYLAPSLLKLGYTNVTVLDISKNAIEKAQKRLGSESKKINWVISNILDFKPTQKYDCWHDRAAFHFLLTSSDQNKYAEIASNSIMPNGKMIIGTFSEKGPKMCSGLSIKQYSKKSLTNAFKTGFKLFNHQISIHTTPSSSTQEFTFCSFTKRI